MPARATFVTPDEDITLMFHCHVPTHEKMGMAGRLIVGRGGATVAQAAAPAPVAAGQTFHGTGTVIAAVPRVGRLIVNHPEIKGFMPAMEMSYPVKESKLLEGVKSGDQVEFTIDGASATITALKVIAAGK